MCQFKSFIALKDKIFFDFKNDSHSNLLEKLGIRDDYLNASKTFVRCEMVPADGDLFNHAPKNWKLNVDQDITPDWFDVSEVEHRFRERHLKEIFDKCFAVNDDTWKEYRDTRLFVKNSKVKTFNSSVEAWGNSSVKAYGNSSVEAWGNSSVKAYGNSSVEAYGNSSVEAYGNSSVEAYENSSVEAWGNSSVKAWGNSSVEAWGNSSVKAWGNSSVVIPYSSDIKVKGVHDNATIKDLSGKPKLIIAKDFEIVKY